MLVPSEVQNVLHCGGGIERLLLVLPSPSERQQVVDDSSGASRFCGNGFDVSGERLIHFGEHGELRETDDRGERIIEFMRYGCSHLTNRNESAALQELSLAQAQLCHLINCDEDQGRLIRAGQAQCRDLEQPLAGGSFACAPSDCHFNVNL